MVSKNSRKKITKVGNVRIISPLDKTSQQNIRNKMYDHTSLNANSFKAASIVNKIVKAVLK